MRSGGERVIGIDFAGPGRLAQQRRKILAVEARRLGRGRYAIRADGLNAQLLRSPPGWTAGDLAGAILRRPGRVSVVAADFPFSIPAELLVRDSFARLGHQARAFASWQGFNRAVAAALPLDRPADYGPFVRWRTPRFWLRRATDVACGAQPPLKDRYQCLFNMTLLGNAFLARLEASGRFDVVPFHSRGRAQVIEVYPGHLMRSAGLPGYKRAPAAAVDAALRLLRRHALSVEVAPDVRAVCERYDTGAGRAEDHDAADALVAACAAILYREGGARAPCAAAPEVLRLEGAIWTA